MKKILDFLAIIILSAIIVSVVIKTKFIDSLFVFLVAGIIPGTNIVVPLTYSYIMLIGLVIISLLIYHKDWLKDLEEAIKFVKKVQKSKKRLPKKRYTSLSI